MRLGNLKCISRRERTLHGRTSNSKSEQSFGQSCVNRIHVLCFVLTTAECRGQPSRHDGAADIKIDLALLVRRLVAGERISRVERFVLEQELSISMKRADTPAVHDLWSWLSLTALPKAIWAVFCSERVVVDPNVLRLGLLLPARRAILIASLR